METRQNNSPLTKREEKELKILDNPAKHRRLSILSPFWLIAQIFYILSPWYWMSGGGDGSFLHMTDRRERTVNLRTKMRMYDLDINPDVDYQKYYEIRREEEKRFDERFNNAN